ncbi:GTP 3',8-cyclase MoaA [Helicobacter monodelphidis]|uniref:GTP 3',8-cyclase MoaA n=1 Tax=Helicobacter sp. 15-1451 TaxID=2004995 RepID=UPI000DCC3F74|nr:GTP 3',8-cyclase MoaA [Helicobacter sp. 15-1451]RAX58932.1 GTP 3',8-cyclase MoaA [Helicobacter sp. 15-1451]
MLQDRFGRVVNYLRISITQKCNFRCQYCMPNTPDDFFDSLEEIPLNAMLNFIYLMIDEGIQKIRITGGEPLLRKDVDDFIAKIYAYSPQVDIALTTNGYFLPHYAQRLKNAGLKRINISLDTLKKEKAILLSKKDILEQTLSGIEEALKAGLKIKLNMVPLVGINDDEILEILEFAIQKGIMLRFIEFMENEHASTKIKGLRATDILNIIHLRYATQKKEKENFGPASLYEIPQKATFGIIAPHDHHFCESCNRIRLNSEGFIIPCLYFDEAINLKEAILNNDQQEMKMGVQKALNNKAEKNRWSEVSSEISSRAFYKTGG